MSKHDMESLAEYFEARQMDFGIGWVPPKARRDCHQPWEASADGGNYEASGNTFEEVADRLLDRVEKGI